MHRGMSILFLYLLRSSFVSPFCSSFSGKIQESARSFPAQRVVIEPTKGTCTAAVLSLRVLNPCSNHERKSKVIVSFFLKVKKLQIWSTKVAAVHLI